MDLCQVSAQFYLPASLDATPDGAAGLRLEVFDADLDGQILARSKRVFTTGSGGALSFFVPRASMVYLKARAQPFSRYGNRVAVPDSEFGTLVIDDGLPAIVTASGSVIGLEQGGEVLLEQGGEVVPEEG